MEGCPGGVSGDLPPCPTVAAAGVLILTMLAGALFSMCVGRDGIATVEGEATDGLQLGV
ncbi:MAG: hypothetical protein LBV60_22630 [Streptomyces sp.]|nr:hypothetical protein [Streptomyces sp.]